MHFSKILFCLAFVVAALAANPPNPKWPTAFSASVLSVSNGFPPQPPRFLRWFYDYINKKERFDGMNEWNGELYFSSIYIDHNAQKQTDVFDQMGTISCFSHSINGSLPLPDFSQFQFAGNSLVNYQPCYHWYWSDHGNITVQFYDTQSAREPQRLDVSDSARQISQTVTFFEFDAAAQDQNTFVVPSVIQAQCNSA